MLKIYLTNLGRYNEGHLMGEWLELPATKTEIAACKKRIGLNDYYEEWFISDYESDLSGLTVDEYDNLDKLNQVAESYGNLDEHEQEKLAAYLEYYGTPNTLADWEELFDQLEDIIFYQDMDLEDLAREFVEEGLFGNVSDKLLIYLDFAALGRDLGFDGYTQTTKGVLHVR